MKTGMLVIVTLVAVGGTIGWMLCSAFLRWTARKSPHTRDRWRLAWAVGCVLVTAAIWIFWATADTYSWLYGESADVSG